MQSTHPVGIHSGIDLSWTLSTASSSSLSLSLNFLPFNQMFHPLCPLLPWKKTTTHTSGSEGNFASVLISYLSLLVEGVSLLPSEASPSTCSHLHILRNSVLLSPHPPAPSTFPSPSKQASVSHVLETALLGSSVAFKLPLCSSLLRQIASQVVDNHHCRFLLSHFLVPVGLLFPAPLTSLLLRSSMTSRTVNLVDVFKFLFCLLSRQ